MPSAKAKGDAHRWRSTVKAVLALVLLTTLLGLATSPPAVASGPDPRWALTPTTAGWELRWRGSRPLPVGGERLTVRQNDLRLGYAREDGSDAVLRLSAPPASLEGLQLWRGTQRVDAVSEAQLRSSVSAEAAATLATPSVDLFDPGTPGPYRTRRLSYRLTPLRLVDYQVPSEVLGEVTVGVGATKQAPLVLILHGRHATCFAGGPTGLDLLAWPCPAGWQPIPSYAGYHAIADLLASRGNVVVSISANSINSQDNDIDDAGAGARSALIRHHLRRLADWSRRGGDPWGGRLRNALDMRRVILVGHSRGGEGVARAALDSRSTDPWRIVGLVPIAPTAFGAQTPADQPTLVILPYCDGDVSDLQGQIYIDGARDLLPNDRALRSALLVRGANHNFFNAEWTPGLAAAPAMDDWLFTGRGDEDPACGSLSGKRLSPLAQQRVGATYTAALVRWALARQDGGLSEIDGRLMRLYLEGEVGAPLSAERAIVQASALGADRVLLYRPRQTRVPSTAGAVTAQWCAGSSASGDPSCPGTVAQAFGGTPHWLAVNALSADHLTWRGSGSVRFNLEAPTDLRGQRLLDLRLALGGETPDIDARLQLVDATGRVATLRKPVRPSFPQAGDPFFTKILARTISAELTGLTRIDLSKIVAINLLINSRSGRGVVGEAFVLDLAARGRELHQVEPRFVPLATVETVSVIEGGTGPQFAAVPIRIDQAVTRPVTYWLETPGANFFADSSFSSITFRPGGPTRQIINLPYQGDDLPLGDQSVPLRLFAKRGGLVSDYIGGAFISEDDPKPVMRLVPTPLSGPEGTALTITVSIDNPLSGDIYAAVSFRAPEGALPEMDSDDIPPEVWQQWVSFDPPSPPLKLSESAVFLSLTIPAGSTSASIEIPLRADGVTEGNEAFGISVFDGFGSLIGERDGGVSD